MGKLRTAVMTVCCIFWLSAALAAPFGNFSSIPPKKTEQRAWKGASQIDSLYLIGKRWELHQPYAAFNWREPGETVYHQMYVIGIVDRSGCSDPALLIYSHGCAKVVELYTIEIPGTGKTWMSPAKADEENSR